MGECLSGLDGLICRDWCRSSDNCGSPAVIFGAAGLLVRAFSDTLGLANRPFSAGFSAFTFPLVISAVALKQSLNILNSGLVGQILLAFEVLIALFVVLYVTFLYTKDILGK